MREDLHGLIDKSFDFEDVQYKSIYESKIIWAEINRIPLWHEVNEPNEVYRYLSKDAVSINKVTGQKTYYTLKPLFFLRIPEEEISRYTFGLAFQNGFVFRKSNQDVVCFIHLNDARRFGYEK